MTMIEKVAAAMWEARRTRRLHDYSASGSILFDHSFDDLGRSPIFSDVRTELLEEARAALLALREPSQEMLEAAVIAAVKFDQPFMDREAAEGRFKVGMAAHIAVGDGRVHKVAWQAAIDTALQDLEG